MTVNPLAPPSNSILLSAFRSHFSLPPEKNRLILLGKIARAFSRMPYENLSKIVKEASLGRTENTRRPPDEVFRDHISLGTGGTCFSLTAALLHLVRSLGFAAEPILADRKYGADTHCALLVWIEGRAHLLDPGYLIVDPLVLPSQQAKEIKTEFNRLRLTPHEQDDRVDLHTLSANGSNYRLTFKTTPADAGEFLRAWDDSFSWDGMRYPVVTCVRDAEQLYLQGNRLQVRDHQKVRRHEIPPDELIAKIATEFGIAPSLVARALAILKQKGEDHGQA